MDGWKEREREGKHCAEAFVAAVNPYRRRTGAVLTAGLSFRATQRDLVYALVPVAVPVVGYCPDLAFGRESDQDADDQNR